MTAPVTPPAADSGAQPFDVGKWRRLRIVVNLAGTVILLAFAVAWYTGYQTNRRLALGVEHVEGTRKVVDTILRAATFLHAADSAHQNYLLNAEDGHVRAYQAAIAAHLEAVGVLRELLSNRTGQVARLDALDTLTAAHIRSLDLGVATVRSQGLDAARARLSESMVRGRAEAIDQVLAELEQDEMRLAAARIQDATKAVSAAAVVLAVTGLFQLLFTAGVFLVFNREITWQKRSEQALRLALQAADAASQAKTMFLANVSHEIRTPLNAVAGMSELLLDSGLDAEQRKFATAVRSNAETLSMLIGDLLDSSRIEANQVFLESEPFNLRELVEGVADLLVGRAEVKGVDLIVDLLPVVPRQLVGDRNRLRQVLMNVVGNAVKFTDHGEVVIRVRSETSGDGRLVTLRMAVADTGIGIAPEMQSAVFDRFVQASRSTVHTYGGTGLGLNISRSLMELMGGTISLQSELGRGSTFEIDVTLPIAPNPQPAETGHSSLSGVEVLLVQPIASLREAIVHLLEFAGASVQAVETPTAADLNTGLGRGARVIVLGERLSESTGLEFAKRVWHARDDAGTPGAGVVLLCSLRAVAARYVGSYGIEACVYAPVKQERLIQAVCLAAGLEIARPQPERVVAGARATTLDRHRILLVEDNPDNLTLATHILVSAGYEVDVAGDGVKAVETAAALRYDLILMDVDLPLVDGIDATRRIRSGEREAGQTPVPIVAVTGHAVESIRGRALSAGMDDYATKPIQKAHLLDLCSRWIDPRPVLLVADDSADIHLLLANFLGSDYRLVPVYNGRDAVEQFERQRVSLVLLDIDLPVMSGLEAARAIRGAPGGGSVPIVALTGYDGAAERQQFIAAGCSAHLSKPVNRATLLALVTTLLGEAASDRRQRSSGIVLPSPRSSERSGMTTAPTLPSSRDIAEQARRLLALRDLAGLTALAEDLRKTAEGLQLSKLETVSEELANAARFEDAQRAAGWGDELAATLGEAQRILDVRHSTHARAGGPYDALARVATVLLGVPLAAAAIQEESHVRVLGGAGLPALDALRALPFSPSFTRLVIEQEGPVLVDDARVDPRLREVVPVRAYGVVSFAAVPLTNSRGQIVGAFGAMDRRPHRWPPAEIAMLEELASVAARLVEMERQIEEAADAPADAAATPPDQRAATLSTLVTVDDDIADLVPGYLAARRADVLALRQLVEEGDFSAIGRLGHRMAGSGAGYGLPDVSRIGKQVERAAGDRDAESLRQVIGRLDAYLSGVSIQSSGGGPSVES